MAELLLPGSQCQVKGFYEDLQEFYERLQGFCEAI